MEGIMGFEDSSESQALLLVPIQVFCQQEKSFRKDCILVIYIAFFVVNIKRQMCIFCCNVSWLVNHGLQLI